MKKKLIIIISVVAVLIVSAVAVYFISMLSDTPSPEAEQEENEARTVVYSDDATLFNSLTVENEHGSYTLVRDGDSIVIEGREQIPLLSASSTSMFETFADVYVVRTISEDSTEGFGFDSPSAVLTVKKADGSEKTMYIGDIAANTEGCRYMCFAGESAVYLMDADRSERYLADKSLLYSKTVSKYFTSDEMVSISIVRPDGEEILLRPSNEEESGDMNFISGYTMEKPFLFGADSDIVTSLCETLAALPSASVVEDDVTEEMLDEYGISNGTTVTVVANYDTTSMTLDSGDVNPYYDPGNEDGFVTLTTVYRIGGTRENLIYFTYDDIPIIYSLTKSDMDFINTETYQYCQRLVNIAYLTDLSGLSVDTCDGNIYDFVITSEADGEGNIDVSSVTLDYAAVDTDNFKSFYQNIVSVSHSDIGTKPEDSDCVLRLTYEFTSGERDIVEFWSFPDDSRKTFMTIDGEGRFVVLMTKVDKIKNDLQKLLSGEEINTN